jgi:hypothetical protein
MKLMLHGDEIMIRHEIDMIVEIREKKDNDHVYLDDMCQVWESEVH